MNDKIRSLQRQIEEEKRLIDNCHHDWTDAFYNPTIEKRGYGSVQDGAGSDPHWSYAGYEDVSVPRWTRKCKKCGYEQHTKERAAVVSHYEPKF